MGKPLENLTVVGLAKNVLYLVWRRNDFVRSRYRILPRIKVTHAFFLRTTIVILPSYGCLSQVAFGFPLFACSLQNAFRMFVWMCELGIWTWNKPSRKNSDCVSSLCRQNVIGIPKNPLRIHYRLNWILGVELWISRVMSVRAVVYILWHLSA